MLKLESYKTRLTGLDQNILINFSSKNDLGGLSDDLNNFIEKNTGLSINPAEDMEIVKFQSVNNMTFYFGFYNTGTSTYNLSLENAGFTVDDFNTDTISKSYYILQAFDTVKSESQKLLHTGFFGLYQYPTGFSTTYNVSSDKEFNSLFINELDLSSLTGNSVYVKLSFFNAKKGKQQLFFNLSKVSDQTENIFYFNGTLDRINRTYNIGSVVNAREFINYEYVNKINENLNTIPEEKPVYPTGGTALSGNTYFTP